MSRRAGLVTAALAVAAASLAVPVATATVRPQSKADATSVKPDYSFYNGKTITFILSNTPGSGGDRATRAIVPAMEAKLHATINIQYVPGAQAIGEDQLATAAPDGLTIGWLSMQSWFFSFLSQTSEVNFTLLKQDFIGALTAQTSVFVACTNSPYHTFKQVIQAGSPISMLEPTAQESTLLLKLIASSFGIPHTNITGYTSTAALQQGCIRGDGAVTDQSASNLLTAAGTAFTPGISPLAISFKEPSTWTSAFMNAQAPTMGAMIARYGKKTKTAKLAQKLLLGLISSSAPLQLWWAPTGVPAARLLALQDAFDWSLKQASVQQGLFADNQMATLVTPDEARANIKLNLKNQTFLTQILNS